MSTVTTNSIGAGKVNVATTMPRELERQISRLAFENDLSRNEYMRRLAKMAVEMGLQFTKITCALLLGVGVFLATCIEDERMGRGRRRKDEVTFVTIKGGGNGL